MSVPRYGSLSIDFIGHTSDRLYFMNSRRALIVRRHRVWLERNPESAKTLSRNRLSAGPAEPSRTRRAPRKPEVFSAAVELDHAGNPDYDIAELPESLLV